MLATCALYFEAQSPRKFVNVTHLRVLGESRIFLSVKANSGSDVNFCPNLESRNFAAVASVSGASIFDRICRGDTSLRPNRRTARRCTSGSNFEKVCRGTEVKPAVTHLSESTSRLSLCLCVTEALACLVLAGGALRGSLSLCLGDAAWLSLLLFLLAKQSCNFQRLSRVSLRASSGR